MKTRADVIRDLVDAHEWAEVARKEMFNDRVRCRQCAETIALVPEATADIEAALDKHERTAHE